VVLHHLLSKKTALSQYANMFSFNSLSDFEDVTKTTIRRKSFFGNIVYSLSTTFKHKSKPTSITMTIDFSYDYSYKTQQYEYVERAAFVRIVFKDPDIAKFSFFGKQILDCYVVFTTSSPGDDVIDELECAYASIAAQNVDDSKTAMKSLLTALQKYV